MILAKNVGKSIIFLQCSPIGKLRCVSQATHEPGAQPEHSSHALFCLLAEECNGALW